MKWLTGFWLSLLCLAFLVLGISSPINRSNPTGVSGSPINNIGGNGHEVRYSASLSASNWLGGKTCSLGGGGRLLPAQYPLAPPLPKTFNNRCVFPIRPEPMGGMSCGFVCTALPQTVGAG